MKLKSSLVLVAALPLAACHKPEEGEKSSKKPDSREVQVDPDFHTVEWGSIAISDLFVVDYGNATLAVEYGPDDEITKRYTRVFDGDGHMLEERVESRNDSGALVLDRLEKRVYKSGQRVASTYESYRDDGTRIRLEEVTIVRSDDDHVETTTKTTKADGATEVELEVYDCQDLVCTTTRSLDGVETRRAVETKNEEGKVLKEEIFEGDKLVELYEFDLTTGVETTTEWDEDRPLGEVTERKRDFKGSNVHLERMWKTSHSRWDTTCTVANQAADCTETWTYLDDGKTNEVEKTAYDLVQTIFELGDTGILWDLKYGAPKKRVTQNYNGDQPMDRITTEYTYDARYKETGRVKTCEVLLPEARCEHAKEIQTRTLNDRGFPTAMQTVDEAGKQISRVEVTY